MPTNKKQEAPLLPVYLIVGEDALKRDAVMKRLRARLSALGDLSFNADEFNGETALGGDVVAACNTVPFASPVRLVEVRAADKLKKADAEALVSYLSSPSGSTVLALVAEKLAKNTRLYKAVAAHGKTAVIDCAPLKRNELPKTVRGHGRGPRRHAHGGGQRAHWWTWWARTPSTWTASSRRSRWRTAAPMP
ncbi:MAG TPA: hypothetical protein OIL86_13630 [Eggerthellaceae bacterium]|nr:hypothetical protein [Eggerthellaceae bacterium]